MNDFFILFMQSKLNQGCINKRTMRYGAFENRFGEKDRVLQNTSIIITDPKGDL